MLGMLERCVADAGGVHAWADTDALAIVSSEEGGALTHIPGAARMHPLPRSTVQAIIDRFSTLNPYEFSGSILNWTKENFIRSDPARGFRRELLGFSISAKRYVLYERRHELIRIIDPKGHGLGYLYPPVDSPPGWDADHELPKWIYEAWDYILRRLLRLSDSRPVWLNRPLMMRIAVARHEIFKALQHWPGVRPYNLYLVPIIAEHGSPAGVDPQQFTLVTRFERDQSRWVDSECVNIDDPNDSRRYTLTTSFASREYGKSAVVDTFESMLYRYIYHPEPKSLGPNREPCRLQTRGLLGRAHIIAKQHRRLGKEVDRQIEEGDELQVLRGRPVEYSKRRLTRSGQATAIASEELAQRVREIGIRELMRVGAGRRILEKITRVQPLNPQTLAEYERLVSRYKLLNRKGSE